ncbi:MAG: phosphohistidine phosphatase SixA [Cyanobacteria bacterium P01_D01_bin.56]
MPAQVYFVRHGIAAERGTYKDDDQRPLVEKGLHKTRKVAQRLADFNIRFDRLLTSPLVRARQTADVLCETALAESYQVFTPLAPNGDIHEWLNWLRDYQANHQTIGLVGHEPDLTDWAQQLVHGDCNSKWVLKKAGILGVTVPNAEQALGNSHLFWLAPPRFVL